MAPDVIRIQLLGDFRVWIDEELLSDDVWRRRRAADLVKLLALAPQRRLGREKVMEALWPDMLPHRAGANLRKAAYHARRATGLSDFVVLDLGTVHLLKDRDPTIDTVLFERAAADALASGNDEECRRAADLYHGELLPDDPYADWCAAPRRRLADLYLRVLEGGKLWGRLVEVDPTNETAHREIIRSHLEREDRAAALRQFEALRVALRDHLGVLPTKETIDLYERALSVDTPDAPTPAERARTLLVWGVVHWERNDSVEAERMARAAQALAVDAGLGRELAEAGELLGLIAYTRRRWPEVFAETFIATLGRNPSLTPFLFDAHLCMSEFVLGETDGIRTIRSLSEEILKAADQTGSTHARALGLLLRGEATLLGGTTADGAWDDLAESVRLHGETGSVTGRALALTRLGQAAASLGDHSGAEDMHRAALQEASRSVAHRHLLPFAYGAMLEGRRTMTLVEEARGALSDPCESCSIGFRVGAVYACLDADRPALAEDLLREAARVASRWSGGPWHAALAEAGAAIRTHRGAPKREVLALLEQAAAEFGASGRPRDEARCRASAAAIG